MKELFMSTYNFGMGSEIGMEEQFRIIKALGYDGVESTHGLTPEVSALLKDLGLNTKTGYVGFRNGEIPNLDLLQKWEIKYLHGNEGFKDRESALYFAEQANQQGKIAKQYGMKMFLHNHTMEFVWNPVENEYCWETVAHNIDSDLVCFQLDAGWAQIAGVDVMALLRKYGHLVKSLHVKPCAKILGPGEDREAKTKEITKNFVPSKDGSVDFNSPVNRELLEQTHQLLAGCQERMEDSMRDYQQVMELAEQMGCESFIVERDLFYTDRITVMKDDIEAIRRFW